MKNQLKLEHLENFLNDLKKSNPELKDFAFQKSDIRCGKRVALAKVNENGAVFIKTDFLLYPEMNNFLRGYSFKSDNRLN